MKNVLQRAALCRWSFASLCLIAWAAQSAAHAADRPARFAVAAAQVQALGITTAPLRSDAESVKASFPAQVAIPPKAEEVVSSPVSGLVSQVLVQQNQAVSRGTPLVRITSRELGQMQLQLLQAAARATLARQAAAREKLLFEEGIIPRRRVQESQAASKEAEAALDHAKGALRLSGLPAPAIERVAASGKTQDSITLAAAQAGIVTEVVVKPGQRVEAATALLNVAQTDTLWLNIQLPVSESTRWPAGTRVKIPDRDLTARILSASPMVSPGSQTVVMRAAIDGRTDRVRPGELVTVELVAGAAAQGGWTVPLAAVFHDADQAYLFVRAPEGFEARKVKVTASAGQSVRVEGPLKSGEQIAVSGVVALKGAWLDGKVSN